MIYAYDGSFLGYLSAVFDAWHAGLDTIDAISSSKDRSLFDDTVFVPADEGKARRILDALQEQCGAKTAHFLYYAFLAEQSDREQALLQYLRQAFRLKGAFLSHLSEPDIWKIRQWARRSSNERHALLGLARFRELPGGMLYCAVAPSCCVVPVMAPHFVRRLCGEEWVIHDTNRHLGVYYDKKDAVIVDIPQTLPDIAVSGDEAAFSSLWRQYYRTIAVAERRNERLRRQCMPRKYWNHIIEMQFP